MRERAIWARITVAVIICGLLVRSRGLDLPWPVAKWSGSILWGAMVYGALRTIVPSSGTAPAGLAAAFVALVVELIRLIHLPWLDEFRGTRAGELLLGRHFSVWNIAAYWMGIGAMFCVNERFRPWFTGGSAAKPAAAVTLPAR